MATEVARAQRVFFQVPGLACEGCARSAEAGLAGTPGVQSVEVELRQKRVIVAFNPARVTPEEIADQLAKAGFPASREAPPEPSGRAFWYAFLAAGVLVLALLGYLAYEFYPRFQLPWVEGWALLLLSAAAGAASFFSPCAFPLLITLLGREAGGEAKPIQRGAVFAASLSVGAAVFLALTGAAVAVGGGAFFAKVTFMSTAGRILRLLTGLFLIALGLVQIGVLPSPFRRWHGLAKPLLRSQASVRRGSPALGFAIFGFGYLLAGFG